MDNQIVKPLKPDGLEKKPQPKDYSGVKKVIIVILSIAVLIFFGWLIMKNRYLEMGFAFKHPEIVKDTRFIYAEEHSLADHRVLERLRMKIPAQEPIVKEADDSGILQK